MNDVSASVVIPTYRRLQHLVRCVESLLADDTGGIEILVVDNADDPDVRERLRDATGLPENLRYVAEPHLGLHNARHRGAREAASDLLLYIDDDAVCEAGWASEYVSAFAAHPEMAAAGGLLLPLWEVEPEPWIRVVATEEAMFTPFSLLDRGPAFLLEPNGFFTGANMAIRRSILFEVGGFNPESFGSASWIGDGETGLILKLHRRGLPIGWVPTARVRHLVPRERMTVSYLRRHARSQGAADAYTRYHPTPPGRSRLLRDGARFLARAAKNVRRRRRAEWHSPEWVLRVRETHRNVGLARYAVRLTYSRKLRALVRRTDWLSDSRS